MTVTYTLDVATTRFSNFIKLLLRWRGSLWKTVYKELIFWLIFYSTLSSLYRFILNDDQKIVFEDIAEFCFKYTDFIPLTFILGFFVSLVVGRWWDMFNNIGWIDNIALYIAAYIQGVADDVRMIRRNIIRYVVLVQALVFRDISTPIRLRFPTMNSLQEAGFLSEAELVAFEGVESPHAKYWLPIHWAMALLNEAREAGHMKNDGMVMDLYNRLREYRQGLAVLICYDWVPIPLVYTQVVFLAVRFYFLVALMGRQYVITPRGLNVKSPIDLYFPILTVVQFLFYMGWMKVAEALLNPFGSDENDFEVNYLLDRNLQAGLTIVDGAIGSLPAQERDKFWHEKHPTPLYSEEMVNVQMNPAIGSATEIPVSEAPVMVQRTDTPADNRKSSRDQSGVGDLLKTIVNIAKRPSSNRGRKRLKHTTSNDPEQGKTSMKSNADISLAKTLPASLNELKNGKLNEPDLRMAATAPASLQTIPSFKTETEKNQETARYLGAIMEQVETDQGTVQAGPI